MQTKSIKITDIVVNNGQIEGVPKNPRFIKDEKYKRLVKSIEDDPEMMQLRELIVYPHEGKYVVIGGNMRLRAMKELGYKDAPCKILPADTTSDKLRAYTIKDNVAFGDNDMEILANEWNVDELMDWGMDVPQFNVLDEIPAEGRMAATLDEKLDTYMNASIKQIVLYYELEEYDYILRKLDDIGKMRDLEDNSSVVKFLVEQFIANNEIPE